jgi:hypothetical protein
VQIELIQQHDDAPTLFSDDKAAGRFGMHHLAFWTTRFDEDLARHCADGFEVAQTAAGDGTGNRNAFFVPSEHPGTIIELSEISGAKGAFFRMVADAAAGWDGSDPVRRATAMRPDAVLGR